MFLTLLACTFFLFAVIAAFKMESPLKGVLFILALIGVCGVLYLFILFPGFSGLAVSIVLAAFILRQSKK
ncbi:hypothetical protein [Pedobacter metabolipauper]|uniref:Uncharacterized protein n=1 Tax=Pedobacter metabolipauper TaxID=425513 RepID=A0A4R6T257_9SPHI|nr:hypothetical protein [Pedobacter metabolipauper]TDQ11610.1 hypothetical protein ATK78_0733 [Pedobacter metabolipauper]